MTNDRRRRPALELRANPLVFALGQVVVSPVLSMSNYVPEIQERLRKEGLPRFVEVETQTVRLQRGQSEVASGVRWVFANRENTAAVVLSTSFIVVEQTVYTRFEEFLDLLSKALSVVNEVADIDLAERVGLRRVNLVDPTESRLPLRKYFKPGLRGLEPEALGVERLDAQLEERGETPAGVLVVRLIKTAGGSALPADLTQTTLTHKQPPKNDEHALLDIDHYASTPMDFDPDVIVDSFWGLHEYSDSAFRAAVTADALTLWKKGPDA